MNPFLEPTRRTGQLDKWMPATKADLNAMEKRLTEILKVIASGDKQRIQDVIQQLNQSAAALQSSVNRNK
jgi:hypothetical protein